jgi:endonuclease/exonuclease/phosphatase family metal-dependent hydrolase
MCLLAFVFALPPHPAHALKLRIMSFNVQQPGGTNWDTRKTIAASIINIDKPDVIGTQESFNDQRDYLLSACPGYACYGIGRDPGGGGEGSRVFYKDADFTLDEESSGDFWLSNTPDSPSRLGGSYNRICSYVRLVEKSSGQGFAVFNIHNYLPNEDDYRMQAVKVMMQRVAERAHTDEPVFITGDFNSYENDAVTRWMKSGEDNPVRCRDSYRDFRPSGSVSTVGGGKLDYVYYPDTPEYSVDSAYVGPSGASDHRPIVGDVVYAQSVSIRPRRALRPGPSHVSFAAVTASGKVRIRTEPAGTIRGESVFDLRGRTHEQWECASSRDIVDLTCMPRGLYLVRVQASYGRACRAVAVR